MASDTKFSSELIFNFNNLTARSEAGVQVVKDFIEFMKKRAEIESEYAKKLNSHYKTIPGASVFTKDPAITKESKTLKEALLGVSEKGIAVSTQHLEVSNKIINDICKSLDNWTKTKDVERKKIIGEGQKLLKTLSEARSNAIKNRANYEKLMKESDLAKDALIKAEKEEISQPEKKNLQQATKRASENYTSINTKAKAQETAYKSSVEKANEELNSFQNEKMPALLEQFQVWETDRWNTLITTVTTYKSSQETLPASFGDQITEIALILENANLENDLKELITSCKKDKDEEILEYVVFKSKHEEETNKPKQEVKVETKAETAKVETTKVENKPLEIVEESNFSNQTAQEKIIAETPKIKEETPEEIAEKTRKAEENKKKAEAAKTTLFGKLDDDSEDIFK